MEWNTNRQGQIIQKWPAFEVQEIHVQHQEQIPDQMGVHHQEQIQVIPQHSLQHTSPTITHIPAITSSKINRSGGSQTPHCLVCNVHLGMFAKGGMEIFSDKVKTAWRNLQIGTVLGAVLNAEIMNTNVHSSIVCKKCFKLLDDIDHLEGKLDGMKQVILNKYSMTLALVKKGLVGKAVLEEGQKFQSPSPIKTKKIHSSISEKVPSLGSSPRKSRPKIKIPKGGKLEVKHGRLIVKGAGDIITNEEIHHHDVREDNRYDDENVTEILPHSATEIIEEIPMDDEMAHTCIHCGKAFASAILLASHMETHGIEMEEYKCDICDKSFLNNESFLKHKKLHTKGKVPASKRKQVCQAFNIAHIKRFKCNQCSKVFSTKSKAEDHERTHTGEKPFECDICGTCFRQKSNLSSHVRVTHLQEKRYRCDLCDKSFKWKRLLNGHIMSVHTGERPYKCEFCESGFVYQQHYKKHMRIHTGEKPFKCDVCGKAFNSSNNCRAHMFTHSDKKPYECTICGQGFMRKPLALTHIKEHGNVDNIEGYVKSNAPTAAVKGDGVEAPSPRKKNVKRESIHATVVHMPQGTQQTHTIEESIPHFIIHNNDNREAGNSGETMSYMFSAFQPQGSVSHYTPLNTLQW